MPIFPALLFKHWWLLDTMLSMWRMLGSLLYSPLTPRQPISAATWRTCGLLRGESGLPPCRKFPLQIWLQPRALIHDGGRRVGRVRTNGLFPPVRLGDREFAHFFSFVRVFPKVGIVRDR